MNISPMRTRRPGRKNGAVPGANDAFRTVLRFFVTDFSVFFVFDLLFCSENDIMTYVEIYIPIRDGRRCISFAFVAVFSEAI